MVVLAKLYEEGRAAERHDVATDTTLRLDSRPVDILIANLSATGCLFVCPEPIELGADVTIGIPGTGRRRARIVRNEREKYGCVFEVPLDKDELAEAFDGGHNTLLMFSSPEAEVADAAIGAHDKLSPRGRLILLATLAIGIWAAIVGAVALLG
jgi:hypothetical protein